MNEPVQPTIAQMYNLPLYDMYESGLFGINYSGFTKGNCLAKALVRTHGELADLEHLVTFFAKTFEAPPGETRAWLHEKVSEWVFRLTGGRLSSPADG